MARRYGFHHRFLAWLLSKEGTRYSAFVEERKRRLLAGVQGTVVEIGPGAGPNLRFFDGDVQVIGIEPNPFMHPYYLGRARAEKREALLVQGTAESLPFADSSVDVILSTLVLCSVPDLELVLAEIMRVLRPGGRFLFIEHVAAEAGSALNRVQRWVRPLWSRIGDGCEPDRRTGTTLLRAGFQSVDLQRFSAPLPIVSPHICGIARK